MVGIVQGWLIENLSFSPGTASYFVSLDLAASGPQYSSNPNLGRLGLMISEIPSSSKFPNFMALFGQESCMILFYFIF